jgi:hypothetical protein
MKYSLKERSIVQRKEEKKCGTNTVHTKRLFSVISFFLAVTIAGCISADKKNISLDGMKELAQEHALVVAYEDGTIKTYDNHGIVPLFKHLDSGDFANSYVFDKKTGKASSLILAYGKASKLYTKVLSKEAIPVLEQYDIMYSADTIVDYIINKMGDDKCPMEKTVADIHQPEEAYKVLKEKFGN